MTSGTIKRIGVLTSGGDCAGLNAAIRAVAQRAIRGYGWEVMGIKEGTRGLMDRPLMYEELSLRIFTGNILRLGGTILGTINKGDPFAYLMPDGTVENRSQEFVDGFHELGLHGLIGIGGDGSMKILRRLARQGGYPFIGIPKTIDNDVPFTEFSIGFASAVTAASEALDHLQPTAASHQRVMILEVMGRDAGHLALNAGIAGGADVILIPEIPYQLCKVADQIEGLREQGRKHALVVCSEAIRLADGEAVTHHACGWRGALRRYRTRAGRTDRPTDRCRDQGHGARARATWRRAVQPRPHHRLGLRGAGRRPAGRRADRLHGGLAAPRGGGRASRRGGGQQSQCRCQRYPGEDRPGARHLSGRLIPTVPGAITAWIFLARWSIMFVIRQTDLKEDCAMSVDERIDALKAKHQALQNAIEQENSRPLPDDVTITSLKKQKLRIKDELATISSQ